MEVVWFGRRLNVVNVAKESVMVAVRDVPLVNALLSVKLYFSE